MLYFKLMVLLASLFQLQCMGGSKMKGISLPNGWLEFKGNEVSIIRPGSRQNSFLLNWGKELGWAQFDATRKELKVQTALFGYEDGSMNEFGFQPWQITTPDYQSFLIYQGRGISLYRQPNNTKPDLKIIDPKFNGGPEWLWVNEKFTEAIVPLAPAGNMTDVFNFGGTPLTLFQIDLVKATYAKHPMDHFADAYLGPDFILWRNYARGKKPGEKAKTSHFSTSDFKLVDKPTPLAKLLNRYRDSLPEFHRRFHISPKGWALMGVHTPNSKTGVFLLNPEEEGQIIPLFEGGAISLPNESLDKCAISDDGQYVVFVTDFDAEKFPSAKSAVVHLGKVEKVKSGFQVRITRLADFADLEQGHPVWIPGTHALVLVTNPLDHPSLIRIYDLDMHPIDWSKVALATLEAKAVK